MPPPPSRKGASEASSAALAQAAALIAAEATKMLEVDNSLDPPKGAPAAPEGAKKKKALKPIDIELLAQADEMLQQLHPLPASSGCPEGLLQVKVRSHENMDDENGGFVPAAPSEPDKTAVREYYQAYDALVKTTIRNLGEHAVTLTPVYYCVKPAGEETERQGQVSLKSGEEAEMQFPVQLDLSEGGGPFLGVDELTYHRPGYEGDTVTARSTVKDKRVSKNMKGFGIVTWHTEGFNQNSELVVDYRRSNLVRIKK